MQPTLAIDYGAACTRAVVVWPGGRWTPLLIDGDADMSSATYVGAGGIEVGAAAWRQATTDPDGFVPSPLHAGTEGVDVGDVEVPVSDLVAAALRRTAAAAADITGGPVEQARLVVPAGWGPRRRTWLRHACRDAGLPVSQLVEAPLAAADYLAPPIDDAQQVLLMIDLGTGCEVSVVRHGRVGREVLSTLADQYAGGDQIDSALVEALGLGDPDDLPAEQRWPLLAAARTAKLALAQQVAVTMPMPGDAPPMVVTHAVLHQAAQPVLERAAALAGQAVTNADLTLDDVDAVYVIGAAAATTGAAEVITATLGIPAKVADQPQSVAVLGAAHAAPHADTLDAPAPWWRGLPWRRLAGLALPGLMSLLLYAHFMFSATFNNGTPARPGPGYYVLAMWGELTVAGVLAAIAALQAATVIAAALAQQTARAGRVARDERITAGLLVAAAGGPAVAGLYGVTAAVYFAYPVGHVLRWAVLPVLPIAAAVLALALLSWRRNESDTGWNQILAFPVSSTLAISGGVVAIAIWYHQPLAILGSANQSVGWIGGILIGVGVACTLVRPIAARAVLSVLLGFFTFVLSRSGPNILAVIYAIAVTVWCAHRVWAVARRPLPRSAATGRTGR